MNLPFEVPPTWKSFHAKLDELEAAPFNGARGYAGNGADGYACHNPVWGWFVTMGGMKTGRGAGRWNGVGCPYGNQYGGGRSQGDIR
jgi:hypothetical protein